VIFSALFSVFDDKNVFVGTLHVVLLARNFFELVVIGKEVVEALLIVVDLRLIKNRFSLQAVQLAGYGNVLLEAVAVKKTNPNYKHGKEYRWDYSHVADAYVFHEQFEL
jgi:hypothetical protein